MQREPNRPARGRRWPLRPSRWRTSARRDTRSLRRLDGDGKGRRPAGSGGGERGLVRGPAREARARWSGPVHRPELVGLLRRQRRQRRLHQITPADRGRPRTRPRRWCAASFTFTTSCPGVAERCRHRGVRPCGALQLRDLVVVMDEVHTEDDGHSRRGDRGRGQGQQTPTRAAAPGAACSTVGVPGTAALGLSAGDVPSRSSTGIGGGSSSWRGGRRLAMLSHNPSGSDLDRIAQCRRHLAVGIELRPATRALRQVLFDPLVFVRLHRIEREDCQQLAGFVVGHHASTP